MSVWSRDQNLHTSYQSDGNNTVKMKRKSLSVSFLSKSGSRKWRSNNLQLARDNTRLKKDLQKCKQRLTENAIRYNILEVSWRRRGETLSRIDIESRMVGNQILKLVDSLAEIRSACQVELSIPVGGIEADNAERISRCRHTMPNVKMGRFSKSHNVSQLSSKSQPINLVNPMVSGHPIIKPTITLQRLNLQNVPSNSPVEQIRSALQELDEGHIEEMDLTTIAENSTDPSLPSSYNSDEEEAVELSVTPSMRRMTACSTPPSYRDIVLPVAEVPLKRLSLAGILDRHKKAMKRDLCSGLLRHDNKTESVSNCISARSPHISLPLLPEQKRVTEVCNNTSSGETTPVNAVYSVSTKDLVAITPVVKNESKLTDQPSTAYTSRTLDVMSSSICSPAATSNWQPNNSSVRKYPPSSRTKTLTSCELRQCQMNGVSERCRLVVALKDVSPYLQNGTLINTEQLEEGKVKTGASAHPETKERNSEDGNKYLEINMLDTSIENQTQLNFTAGIGTMDYSAVSLNNSDVQGSRLSAKEEFLNRIQNEDPLEGPSWRFQSDSTPTGRKGTKSKPVISYQFIKKGKYESQWSNQSSCVASEKQTSDKSKHQPTENHPRDAQAEKEAVKNDEDMDITECVLLRAVESDKSIADEVHVGKETNNCSVHTSDHCKTHNPEVLQLYSAEEVILSHRKRPEVKYNNDISDESESGEEWKPKKRARKKCSRSKAHSTRTNRKSLSRNMKNPKSRSVAEESTINREESVVHRELPSISQSRETSPQLENKENVIKKENECNTNEEYVRAKRKAAPVCLKEVSLIRKMRRDIH